MLCPAQDPGPYLTDDGRNWSGRSVTVDSRRDRMDRSRLECDRSHYERGCRVVDTKSIASENEI